MKKQLAIVALLLSCICGSAFAAKDSLEIKPNTNGLCCWDLTVKNRNAQAKAIDEIRFQIITADSTVFEDLKNVSQWTENIFNLTASYVAEVSPIPAGGTKSDFGICLGVTKHDRPVSVKWVTYNSLIPIDSGTIQFICTPTQSYRNDSVSVVPSVVNNNPQFVFTLYNQNDYAIPLSRFAAQLVTPASGTMRPSKITAPSGWKLDSVTNTFAYFSTLSGSDILLSGESKSGFKITLRGNPSVNSFSFAWFAYDDGGALISRDTIRNLSATFTGFAPDADTLKAAVLNGCLYEITVKNFHVSNQIPISKIRKVVLWRKSTDVSFSSAPSAPVLWTKTVKPDSVIYTATHDSLSIPSGIANSLFRFSVDALGTPFALGWRTYRTLTDTLTSGSMTLQCQKEPPRSDTATLSDVELCTYILKVFNEHNQPPSNLSAVKLSIPAGKGKLAVTFNTLNWNKQDESDTSVTFVAPVGFTQPSGTSQDFLFGINPSTPGEQFPIRWATYDDVAFTSGSPLFSGQHTVGCTPIVNKCDTVTFVNVASDTCTYNYSFTNLRDTLMNRIVFEVGNGWSIFTAEGPTNWKTNIYDNDHAVEYFIAGALGIPRDSTLSGFVIRYVATNLSDTFNVTVKRYDLKEKECVDNFEYICKSSTTGIDAPAISASNVTVHPNPVTGEATLTFAMEKASRATITVLDLLGREVKMVQSSLLSEGEHTLTFSLYGLESGSYYLRIHTPSGVVTKKVVYLP